MCTKGKGGWRAQLCNECRSHMDNPHHYLRMCRKSKDFKCQRAEEDCIMTLFCYFRSNKMSSCDAVPRSRFYGKLLQSLMDCDEDTVDRIRTSVVSRLGPEMTMLIQLLQSKPCPSTAVAAAAAIPTGVEGRGSWRFSMGPHMYKIQPNLRSRESASSFGKRRSAGDSS